MPSWNLQKKYLFLKKQKKDKTIVGVIYVRAACRKEYSGYLDVAFHCCHEQDCTR